MRPSRSPLLPVTPAVLSDARALISDPEAAAAMPETIRRLAWAIFSSAHGRTVKQRHRPANSTGGR